MRNDHQLYINFLNTSLFGPMETAKSTY